LFHRGHGDLLYPGMFLTPANCPLAQQGDDRSDTKFCDLFDEEIEPGRVAEKRNCQCHIDLRLIDPELHIEDFAFRVRRINDLNDHLERVILPVHQNDVLTFLLSQNAGKVFEFITTDERDAAMNIFGVYEEVVHRLAIYQNEAPKPNTNWLLPC
jgi:hypothetical protein